MAVNLKEQAEAHERAHQGLPFGTDEKPYWLDNETNESEQTANDNSTIPLRLPSYQSNCPKENENSNKTTKIFLTIKSLK